jgi:hypothetical protein
LQSSAEVPAFATEVRGDTLVGAGLRDGDVAWVDPDAKARPGDLVLARVDDWNAPRRLQLCRLLRARSGARYLAIQPTPRPEPLPHASFEVIGRVTSAVCQISSRAARSRSDTRHNDPRRLTRSVRRERVALDAPYVSHALRVRVRD